MRRSLAVGVIALMGFMALGAGKPDGRVPNGAAGLKRSVVYVETGGCYGGGDLVSYSDGKRIQGLTFSERHSNFDWVAKFYFRDSKLVRVVQQRTDAIWDEKSGMLVYGKGQVETCVYTIRNGKLVKCWKSGSYWDENKRTAAELVREANQFKQIAHGHKASLD